MAPLIVVDLEWYNGCMTSVLELITYEDGSGLLLEFEYDGDTLWLSTSQIAALFGTSRQNVEYHIQNIYKEDELNPERTSKENLQVVGNRPNLRVAVYNLDMVISVGYRVKSTTATKFRQWATRVIKERTANNYAAMAQEEAVRILTRSQVEEGEGRLISVIRTGHHVVDEDSFLAAGDEGLYHMSRDEVESNRLIPGGKLYDYIGSAELGMHVFRLTQTAEALRVDAEKGYRHEQEEAEVIHRDIAERTRAQAHLAHGQYPEDLPIAEDIETVKLKHGSLLRKLQAGRAAHGEQIELDLE